MNAPWKHFIQLEFGQVIGTVETEETFTNHIARDKNHLPFVILTGPPKVYHEKKCLRAWGKKEPNCSSNAATENEQPMHLSYYAYTFFTRGFCYFDFIFPQKMHFLSNFPNRICCLVSFWLQALIIIQIFFGIRCAWSFPWNPMLMYDMLQPFNGSTKNFVLNTTNHDIYMYIVGRLIVFSLSNVCNLLFFFIRLWYGLHAQRVLEWLFLWL